MIGKLVNEKKLSQFYDLQMFGTDIAHPLEKMLLYFDLISNTVSREMDNNEIVNVVMV